MRTKRKADWRVGRPPMRKRSDVRRPIDLASIPSPRAAALFRQRAAWFVRATLIVAPLGGCEAVLGADFGDYGPEPGDAARDAIPHDGQITTGGAGGSTNDPDATSGAGGSTTGTIGTGGLGGASGTAGSTGKGGAAGVAGSNGSTIADASMDALVDARIDVPAATADRNVTDVAKDIVVTRDAAISDADAPPAPPRDGAVTGGGCTPGQVNSIAMCGNCGLYLQTCNPQGTWDPPSCQQEPTACAPGSTEQRTCESNGTQQATCSTACKWTLGACVHPTCTANQVDTQPCALCGKQSRTCQTTDAGGGEWGPYSACTQQGTCAAGSKDVTTCGKCGTHSRVCNPSCAWDTWGACTGEGDCSPGATETENCEILLPIIVLGKRSRTCNQACGWGPFGECK